MIELLKKIFNELFLIKRIESKTGELHFLRYRLFSSPWFRIYIHKICLSDYDLHCHNHPWNFISLILKGIYKQKIISLYEYYKICFPFNIFRLKRDEFHHLTLLNGPVWTIVFAYGQYHEWGYLTESGFCDHKTYRKLKNSYD